MTLRREKPETSARGNAGNEGISRLIVDYFRLPCPEFRRTRGHAQRPQYTSISLRSRVSNSPLRPPIAFLRILVAKFLGPSSSAPEGGPLGCLRSWLTALMGAACGGWGTETADGEGAGRPIPNPSYNLLVASSRGDRGGISCEEGVLGEPPDRDDPEEEASSASTSYESIAITGRGCDTATLNRRG